MDFLLHHTPLLYLTQSLWRDEAFSILLTEKSPAILMKIIFEPPLYYLLLHVWIKIFGNGEIAARSLSLVGFSLATVVMIVWAEKLFKKHWLSWFLPLFFFFNPMLLYYAFEVRAYGWYIFFAVASMYAYMQKQWKWYIAATVLGLYTHTYMVIVPALQITHYLFIHRKIIDFKHVKAIVRDPMVRSVTVIGILIAPWLLKVFIDLSHFKESWYFPVDMQLLKSAVGNIFLGYEGTPWFLWPFTAIVSLFIVIASVFSVVPRHTRVRNSFFFLMVFAPLTIIIGISFFKPLFVNRYVIPSTIAEVFLVVFAIECITNKYIQKIMAAFVLLFVLGFNIWYPSMHPKLDIRNTMQQINALMGKHDVILAEDAIIFFETVYYSNDRSKVFLYNPTGKPFPWYIGDAIVSQSQVVNDLPPYPTRAFIVRTDGSYEIIYSANISYKPKIAPAQRRNTP